jgi:hypothetical protein
MKFLLNKTNIIIIVIAAVIIFGGAYFYDNKLNNLRNELQIERNLKMALIDSVEYYTNKHNEVVAEKLTLQVKLKDLGKINDDLSVNQKELLNRLFEIEKEKEIIAAALVDMQFKVDSLLDNGVVTVQDSSVTFSKINDNINYKIRVNNVRPIDSYEPSLYFEQINIFNRQFIEFHWEDNKDYGYPVSFSITNTNPYFLVNDVDSYIIPEIKKVEVKPTFWQKFGETLKSGKDNVIWIGVGAGLMFLLTK